MITTVSNFDLRLFTGSETWYRHGIVRRVRYTEGVQYVAEKGQAYWLLDEIALAQVFVNSVTAEAFQVWKLTLRPDQSADLTCEDGRGQVVFLKEIDFTDFPVPQITLWFTNNTILLPSEY